MWYQFLTEHGFDVICFHGSVDVEERKRVHHAFAKAPSACGAPAAGWLDVLRDGLDQELIMLRPGSPPEGKGSGS